MASWLGSLDAVVRLQSAAVLLTVVLALAAALSGAASYYLSRRATALSSEAAARRLEEAREQARVELEADRSELDESRRMLQAAEERADKFLDRIEALEEQLSQKPAPVRESRPPSRPARAPAESAAPDSPAGAISAEQRARLIQSLNGKASGEITLVAISGDRDSMASARTLASLLRDAGWKPEVVEAVFRSRPDGLVFVVHGPDAIPDRQYVLAQALADANLIALPAKMIVNPTRPAGFLGLLMGTPGG